MLDTAQRRDGAVGMPDGRVVQNLFHIVSEFPDIFLAQCLPFLLLGGR